MRTRFFLLFLFIFVSCSKPKQEKQIQAKAESLKKESIPLKQPIQNVEKAVNFKTDLLDKKITDLLTNKTTKKTKYQEYGGGDCYGGYSIYSDLGSKQELVMDKYDCGDYGFANKQFLLSSDKIERVRDYKFEYNGSEDGTNFRFEVAENIYYFKDEKVLIKSRKKYTQDYTDTLLNNLQFNERIISADSVYRFKVKELEDILASTLSED